MRRVDSAADRGTAALRGIPELAEQVFEMPARIGTPREVAGVADLTADPRYATSLGLARYGASRLQRPARSTTWQKSPRWREWIRARLPFVG